MNNVKLMIFSLLLCALAECSTGGNRGEQEGQVKEVSNTDGDADLFSRGEKLSELKSKKLNEVSGLAASIANPGMLWALNDSGNDPEVYLIDLKTTIKRTYVLKGISNRDWEEIGVGPGPKPGKNYLYVGDIGDNMAIHTYKYIYRFEEPLYEESAGKEKIEIANFDTQVFWLSDEVRDTEAFAVDPRTHDIYLISKWSTPTHIYQLKAGTGSQDTAVAKHIGTLPMSTVVAADFNRDGSELLVKTYGDVFYWKRDEKTSVSDMLKRRGRELPYDKEPQGESVTFSANGDGYYTLSEQKKNKAVYLMFYRRL